MGTESRSLYFNGRGDCGVCILILISFLFSKVWDIKNGRTDPVLTLVGHSGAVRCLHLSGNRLVSGSADATIKVLLIRFTCVFACLLLFWS